MHTPPSGPMYSTILAKRNKCMPYIKRLCSIYLYWQLHIQHKENRIFGYMRTGRPPAGCCLTNNPSEFTPFCAQCSSQETCTEFTAAPKHKRLISHIYASRSLWFYWNSWTALVLHLLRSRAHKIQLWSGLRARLVAVSVSAYVCVCVCWIWTRQFSARLPMHSGIFYMIFNATKLIAFTSYMYIMCVKKNTHTKRSIHLDMRIDRLVVVLWATKL